MLVNLRDITAIAEQNNMAIGAFNSPSLESARAAIDTAEKLVTPLSSITLRVTRRSLRSTSWARC